MKHIIPQAVYWLIAVAMLHQTYLMLKDEFTKSEVWSAVFLNYVGASILLAGELILLALLAAVVALITEEAFKKQ